MNKAFFGKTMENVRDGTKLKFIDNSQLDQIIKQRSKLSFKFDREETVFSKPIYLGFSVLELSKLLI